MEHYPLRNVPSLLIGTASLSTAFFSWELHDTYQSCWGKGRGRLQLHICQTSSIVIRIELIFDDVKANPSSILINASRTDPSLLTSSFLVFCFFSTLGPIHYHWKMKVISRQALKSTPVLFFVLFLQVGNNSSCFACFIQNSNPMDTGFYLR